MLVHRRSNYDSDLTASEWEYIRNFLPEACSSGRPRSTDLKEVINAIFYLNRSGCAWRYLPKEFPPWQTVYRYFRKFEALNLWQSVLLKAVLLVRSRTRDREQPRLMIVDAQSVRARQGEARGYDGFKKVQGRKREILVDSTGLILSCSVHRANQAESRGGVGVLDNLRDDVIGKPEILLGDHAYGKPPFETELFSRFGIWPTIRRSETTLVTKPDYTKVKSVKVSNLKPQRWIVERSFAWMNYYRRLAHDYERLTKTSEAQIYVCGLQLALHRLHPPGF